MPKYETIDSSGMDLADIEKSRDKPGQTLIIPTGIHYQFQKISKYKSDPDRV